jgi:hypothetical protein
LRKSLPGARHDPRGAIQPRRVLQLVECVLVALAFTVAVCAPTAASTAGPGATARPVNDGSIGLRLVDVPVAAGNDPRARVYIVDHLSPGAVIHRRIEVSNTTAATVHVGLYAAAATIANASFLGSAGRTPNELSTWASVEPSTSDVPGGGRLTATVTITVPRDASPGERYGVVWAETRSTAARGGVVRVSRVGIRLYISVGPGGPPASNFTIEALTAERTTDGQPMVVATVHNNGGRALDMSGSLRLSAGPAGLSAGPFPAALGVTLAIGATEPVTIALDRRLLAGPWDARMTLTSGLLERHARATITFPDIGTATAVKTTPSRPDWLDVAAIVLGVVMLLVAGGVAIARTRRAHRQRHLPTDVSLSRWRLRWSGRR